MDSNSTISSGADDCISGLVVLWMVWNSLYGLWSQSLYVTKIRKGLTVDLLEGEPINDDPEIV